MNIIIYGTMCSPYVFMALYNDDHEHGGANKILKPRILKLSFAGNLRRGNEPAGR